jgi:predicted DCC family thiol-disulfide oxidoreductase YuxK
MEDQWQNIILFDGVCNLCNRTVQFIIKRDKKNKFKFAALQSNFGQGQLSKYQINRETCDTVVYIRKKKAFVKSTAALYISKELKRGWQILFVFIIFPLFIRDWFYDIIAKNRYKMFGKKETCTVPTPELRAKFLD